MSTKCSSTVYSEHPWEFIGESTHKWCPACGALAVELGLDMPAGWQVKLPQIAQEIEYLDTSTERSERYEHSRKRG